MVTFQEAPRTHSYLDPDGNNKADNEVKSHKQHEIEKKKINSSFFQQQFKKNAWAKVIGRK